MNTQDNIDHEFNNLWLQTELNKSIRDEQISKLTKEHDRLNGKNFKWIGIHPNTNLFYKTLIAKDETTYCLQNKILNRELGFTVSCDNQNIINGELSDKVSKIFTYFPYSDLEVKMYDICVCLEKGKPDKRTFYEVMEPHHKRKPYLDIDMNDQLEQADEMMLNVLDAIQLEMLTKVDTYEHHLHTLIFQSHSDKKKSFHIVIDHYCFENNIQTKSFFFGVKSRVKKEYHLFLDGSVYNNNGNFRMYKSHKLNTTRTKELTIEYNTYNPENQKDIWLASLITNTNYCIQLENYEIKVKPFMHEEISNTLWDQIVVLWLKYEDHKSFKFKKGKEYLLRKQPSYCPIHKRDHGTKSQVGNNGMLSVWNGSLYFTCFSDPCEKINLGKIEIPEQPLKSMNDQTFKNMLACSGTENYKEMSNKVLSSVSSSQKLKNIDENEEGNIWCDLTYSEIKLKFEKKFFKCVSKGIYYQIENNCCIVRNRKQMMDCYCHLKYISENTDKKGNNIKAIFIKDWLYDEHIRKYEYVELLPPPLKCPTNTYNLWNGWRIEHIKTDEANEEDVQFIFDHFTKVFGEENIEYILNWFAYYFQFPGLNPKIALLLKSLEGLGKGAIMDLLILICGSQYIYLTEEVERDVFGHFNHLLEGVLILGLDEMELKTAKKFSSKLKNMITNSELTINSKGVKPYKIPNRLHVLSYSNQRWPWSIDESNRRYLAIDSSTTPIPPESYFEKLYSLYANDAVLKQVLLKFMKRDIKNFKPVNMPNTSFLNDLKELNRSFEENFIIDYIQTLTPHTIKTISSLDFFNLYVAYIDANCKNIEVKMTSTSFNKNIQVMNIDGFETKSTNKCNLKEINVDKALQWCYNKKYIIPPK